MEVSIFCDKVIDADGLGADIDLARCDPGDLDPHAVSGIFKSYLRECKQYGGHG
jgi:hypothetical protein